jgi:hypothetical protein
MTKKGILNGVVCTLALAMVATGCAEHRRWGMCALGGGLLGATVGGVGAASSASTRRTTALRRTRPRRRPHPSVPATGGIIGALLGHYICDPIEEPVAQAAPPVEAPPPVGHADRRASRHALRVQQRQADARGRSDPRSAPPHDGEASRPSASASRGNTDSVGSDAYNMRLGQRRADSAESYLVSHGILRQPAVDRFPTAESKPIASNDTAEGAPRTGAWISSSSNPARRPASCDGGGITTPVVVSTHFQFARASL